LFNKINTLIISGEKLYMPFINVKVAGELTEDQKKKIAKEITDTMERVAGKPKNYTYIVFEEVAHEDWAIGGKLLGGGGE
jgi:4-oxalocrotonate tautomerase